MIYSYIPAYSATYQYVYSLVFCHTLWDLHTSVLFSLEPPCFPSSRSSDWSPDRKQNTTTNETYSDYWKCFPFEISNVFKKADESDLWGRCEAQTTLEQLQCGVGGGVGGGGGSGVGCGGGVGCGVFPPPVSRPRCSCWLSPVWTSSLVSCRESNTSSMNTNTTGNTSLLTQGLMNTRMEQETKGLNGSRE